MRDAGLTQVAADELDIRRRRCGRGFVYLDGAGEIIRNRQVLERIRALAIPPNYDEVRISANAETHLQATGRDAAGRLQYRYHPDWETVREHLKIDRLAVISGSVSKIRSRIARDIRRPVGSRKKALAASVMLLDKTHIRIGCEGYVHSGRSRGAATLLKRNISLNDGEVRLRFRGKGGREIEQSIVAPALARAIDELRTIPGRRIFQYRDEAGRVRVIRAGDVNGYLGEVAGAPVTAKDFRALAANAEAARRLADLEPHARPNMRRRQVAEVIRQVADLLGNTPAIARKSYVHGELVAAFTDERLAGLQADRAMAGRLPNGEKLVAALFSSRASSG